MIVLVVVVGVRSSGRDARFDGEDGAGSAMTVSVRR